MNSTKDNWIKAWNKESNKLLKYLHGNECLPANFDEVVIKFISQVEKDAIEKTNKRCKRQIEEMLRDMLDDGRPLGDVIKERISDLIEDNT